MPQPGTRQRPSKGHLQDIWLAETKDRAEKAFDFFLEARRQVRQGQLPGQGPRGAHLLRLPAEWKHLRTTNPIESTFATVRLRTIKTKGCLSRTTACLQPVGSQEMAASRRILPREGVKFKDGEKLMPPENHRHHF